MHKNIMSTIGIANHQIVGKRIKGNVPAIGRNGEFAAAMISLHTRRGYTHP